MALVFEKKKPTNVEVPLKLGNWYRLVCKGILGSEQKASCREGLDHLKVYINGGD
jgi:hypothetical protein